MKVFVLIWKISRLHIEVMTIESIKIVCVIFSKHLLQQAFTCVFYSVPMPCGSLKQNAS
jgi:hypothetical protein